MRVHSPGYQCFFGWELLDKYYSHVYEPMAPPTHHGPQDATQQVNQEVAAEEDELRAMEYSVVLEVEYPKPTLRACSIQGHVSSSQATHEASFSSN